MMSMPANNTRRESASVPRSSSPWRGALVVVIWIVLLTFGTLGRAEAHASAFPAPMMGANSEAGGGVSIAATTIADDETCPALAGHSRRHCCGSNASCHAMTTAIVLDTNLDCFGCAPEAAPDRGVACSDVAPLFHPPKS